MSVSRPPELVTFSTKGQVVIPSWLRSDLGIQEGTQAVVRREGNEIVLTPVTADYIRSLRGSIKQRGALQALLDERRRERDA